MTNRVGTSTIMVVDDEAENLAMMDELLRFLGYEVTTFARGRLALAAAVEAPPDLILLDISMPEMDGYEVCRQLKAAKALARIPVIFLSALHNTEDKVRAFRSGAADYITKPFQLDEVHVRVETQLQLQRAQRVERELLEKTLNGAVSALAELVHFAGPALSPRSEIIRSIVVRLASRLGVEEPWRFELAAMLCLIGCMALPAEAFERAYGGDAVSAEEGQMFREHPEAGARLLANIPRLEHVADMIRRQLDDGDPPPTGDVALGVRMLRLALELDRRMFRGMPFRRALDQLRTSPPRHPPEMLDALEDYSPPRLRFATRRVQVRELQVSMVVEDPVMTEDGDFMILQKGTLLNSTLIERVRNFAKTRGIREPIHVRVQTAVRDH